MVTFQYFNIRISIIQLGDIQFLIDIKGVPGNYTKKVKGIDPQPITTGVTTTFCPTLRVGTDGFSLWSYEFCFKTRV